MPANAEETVVPTPVAVEPTEAEFTPAATVPQPRHEAVQVDPGNGAKTDDRELALFLGVFLPEGEQVADGTSIVAFFLHQPDGFFGRYAAIEVEDIPLPVADLLDRYREPTLGKIAVAPVIVAGGDAILEVKTTFDSQKSATTSRG